eukprot:CFRG4357T1
MELSDFISASDENDEATAIAALKAFTQANLKSFSFCDHGYPLLIKQEFISTVLGRLCHSEWKASDKFCGLGLLSLRLLSRERKGLDELQKKESMEIILQFACKHPQVPPGDARADDEAIKCLINAIHSNPMQQKWFVDTNGPEIVLEQAYEAVLRTIVRSHTHAYVWYALRLLFVAVATTPGAVEQVIRTGGERKCVEMLESMVGVGTVMYENEGVKAEPSPTQCTITELCNVLFSITSDYSRFHAPKPHARTVGVTERSLFRRLLLCIRMHLNSAYDANRACKTTQTFPLTFYPKPTSLSAPSCISAFSILYNTPKGLEMDFLASPTDTHTLDMLVEYIHIAARTNKHHELLPMLTVTYMYTYQVSHIRKYLRTAILPRRTDYSKRPEEEDSVRGSLVKLMTSHQMDVKDLVADVLFVLCKGDTQRLIRHVGYGNAAGLLASKGLLNGGCMSGGMGGSDGGEYSDDSEGSDIEEDLQERRTHPNVNPVTGSYFSDQPNPFSHLSEEEKEREAEKLMMLFNKLESTGVMQVMGTNKNGDKMELPRVPMPPKK